MGLFSFLFGSKKNKERREMAAVDMPAAPEEIKPEVIAAVTAAVYAMIRADRPGVHFRITRVSRLWSDAGRQGLMDSQNLAGKEKRRSGNEWGRA